MSNPEDHIVAPIGTSDEIIEPTEEEEQQEEVEVQALDKELLLNRIAVCLRTSNMNDVEVDHILGEVSFTDEYGEGHALALEDL